MDVIMLNILFFLLYALLFIICIGIIHFIFTILEVTKGVEGPGYRVLTGILAGISSSLIMILIIHNMPI